MRGSSLQRLLLLMLIGFVVLVQSHPQPARSQAAEALPPVVIEALPIAGEELMPDDPLTISFDQPMEPGSVEAALSITPTLPEGLELLNHWPDARTLQVFAQNGWPRSMAYTLTIGKAARSQDGVPLAEAYSVAVRTLGPLKVGSVNPQPDAANVALSGTQIIVSFNRPILPLAALDDLANAPTPIRIAPVLEGSGHWVNSSLYLWMPTGMLPPSTTYTVSITDDLTAADGGTLDAPYSWQFTSAPPSVLAFDVLRSEDERVTSPGSAFRIRFTDPMTDHEAVHKAFSFKDEAGKSVAGALIWSKTQEAAVTFQPYFPLAAGTLYTLTLEAGPVAEKQSATFRTTSAPTVNRIMYGEKGIPGTFVFSTSIRPETLFGRFSITPDPGPYYLEYQNVSGCYEGRPSCVALHFTDDKALLKPGVQYTVHILDGVEDVFGNPGKSAYTTTFTIPNPPTPQPSADDPNMEYSGSARPVINGDLMQTGTYNRQTTIPLVIAGRPTVRLSLYRVNAAALSTVRLDNYLHSYSTRGYFNQNGLNDSSMPAYDDGSLTPPEPAPWVKRENLLRQWTEKFNGDALPLNGKDAQGDAASIALVPLAAGGGRLPAGIYWVTVESDGSDVMWQYGLSVSSANLTLKRAPRETLVWVTDLVTSKPVANTQVTVYNRGKAVASGLTDSKGVFIAPVSLPSSESRYQYGACGEDYTYVPGDPLNDFITVSAESAGVFGSWFMSESYDIARQEAYLHTDRPLYRPGETVYLRGLLRDKFDVTYTLPKQQTVKVRAVQQSALYDNPESRCQTIDDVHALYDAEVPLSPFGTFDGAFKIPADARSDDLITIYTSGGDITIAVREFRVPEYEVKVSPTAPYSYLDQTSGATLKASYYSGGAVSDAAVAWRATYTQSYFNYTGPGAYRFYDPAWYRENYYEAVPLDQGAGKTDAKGGYAITLKEPATFAKGVSSPPISVLLQASVRDEAGQTITGSTQFTAYSSAVYVGCNSTAYFVQLGQPGKVNCITVTPESQPVANQRVEVEINRSRWFFNPEQNQWVTDSSKSVDAFNTGADGKGVYTLDARQPGYYELRFRVQDPQGRVSTTTEWLYITNRTLTLPTEKDEIELNGLDDYEAFKPTTRFTTDKPLYKPGETAQVLLPAPFDRPATMLITVERNQFLYYDVVRTDDHPQTYALKVTDSYAPDVYFSTVSVTPIDRAHPLPTWRIGQTFFGVEPTARYLNVAVKPRQATAKPGERVDVDVTVTDREGKPVSAEIGLSVVDKAVLALSAPNSYAQKATFYPISDYENDYRWAYNPIPVQLSMYGLQERLTGIVQLDAYGGGRGGAGGPPSDQGAEVNVRKDYKVTPLWEPHLVTDAQGKASATVTVPDNLTTWTIDARAVTTTTQVGEGRSEFISTLPLIVRPVAPRFMVAGDTLELAAVVNNNTGKDQTVAVTLQARGVSTADPQTQIVAVPNGGRMRVTWHVTVEDAPSADLTFIAKGDGAQDAAKPPLATGKDGTIPIYPFRTTETLSTHGALRAGGSRTEIIAIPPRYQTGISDLTLRIDPSIASAALDSLTYLQNFPHQCNEQTTSRFLPNLMTLRALKSLGQSQPTLEANLRDALADGLTRLKDSQNTDGGWGWWPGQATDDYITAYVLFGLTQAQRTGYSIPPEMIARGVAYIRGKIAPVTLTTAQWMLNRQAFLLYMLADAEITSDADATNYAALVARRPAMTFGAKAYLLMAYLKRFPGNAAIKDLLTDLESNATIGVGGVSWGERYHDWYNWGSDVRSTALAIAALLRAKPDSPLLPDAVRWLMAARSVDAWATTQETTWSVLALTDYMLATNELSANYGFTLTFNRKPAANGTITPATARDTQTLNVQVADLLTDRANRFTVSRTDGAGVLYYTAAVQIQIPAAEVKPAARGVSVTRTYTNEKGDPVASANVGDLLNVTLSLTVRDEAHFVALEDPIPAGTEIENDALLTSGNTDDNPYSRFYSYGWWYFDYREFKDNAARFYANYLPAGTYTLQYQTRATLPGEFQVLPATAYAFYAPEWFGRTAGQMFSIEAK